jgi:DNA-binding transcriptional ArsR family regulator
MSAEEHFGTIVQVIGEKSRASMLWHLLGDTALTATELALCADISPQSASMHLNKLVRAGLLAIEKRGRYRYYRISNVDVAYAVEAMASLVPAEKDAEPGREAGDIRYCRTCYDHLAGKIGVLLTEQLLEHKIIHRTGSRFKVTGNGAGWFESLGIEIAAVRNARRTFARACLGVSEDITWPGHWELRFWTECSHRIGFAE